MSCIELKIKNPITLKSIEELFDDIKDCNSALLLINVGAHNFESIEVLKEFKKMFNQERELLSSFKKIAFLHPAEYQNESEDKNRYNFFSDREKAINWLTTN